jgi:hypothetical protein
MSRSGYSDDCENLELWRGAVDRAIQGKRGQAFLKDLLAALDAMPEKALIADALECEGKVCAIGALGKARGIDMSRIDPEESKTVAKTFGIAPALAKEIVYENDEGYAYWGTGKPETPEQRWQRMRNWVAKQIVIREG